MPHAGEVTEKQKQRQEQAKLDLEMEHQIIEWIDKVLHKRPAIEDEEHYIQFIKWVKHHQSTHPSFRSIFSGFGKDKPVLFKLD